MREEKNNSIYLTGVIVGIKWGEECKPLTLASVHSSYEAASMSQLEVALETFTWTVHFLDGEMDVEGGFPTYKWNTQV